MNSENKIEFFSIIGIAVLLEFLMPFIKKSFPAMIVLFITVLGVFLYFVKKKTNMNNNNFLKFFSVFVHTTSYLLIRIILSAVTKTISIDFCDLDAGQISQFGAWFSIGYSLMQIPMGAIIQRFGSNAYIICGSLGSLFMLISGFIPSGSTMLFGTSISNYILLCITRLISGAFFSSSILSFIYVLSKISSKWFSFTYNLAHFASLNIASEITSYTSSFTQENKTSTDIMLISDPNIKNITLLNEENSINTPSIDMEVVSKNTLIGFTNWRSSSILIGIAGLVSTFIYFLADKILDKQQIKQEIKEEQKDHRKKNFTLTNFFLNGFLMAITISSIGVMTNYFILSKGYIKDYIMKENYSSFFKQDIVELILNKAISYGMLLMTFILSIITPEKIIYYSSALNLIGILLLIFFYKIHIGIVALGALLSTSGVLGTGVQSIIINRDFPDNSTFIYSIVNFFSMAIGVAGAEWLVSIVLGNKKNLISTDIISMLKIVCLPFSIIGLVFGLYVYYHSCAKGKQK